MTTLTASQARQNFFALVKKSVRGHVPVKITSKNGDAILLSQEDYESLLETLELLSVPGMLKSIRKADEEIQAGRTKSMKDIQKPYRLSETRADSLRRLRSLNNG